MKTSSTQRKREAAQFQERHQVVIDDYLARIKDLLSTMEQTYTVKKVADFIDRRKLVAARNRVEKTLESSMGWTILRALEAIIESTGTEFPHIHRSARPDRLRHAQIHLEKYFPRWIVHLEVAGGVEYEHEGRLNIVAAHEVKQPPEFWTVYGRRASGEALAIDDYPSAKKALRVALTFQSMMPGRPDVICRMADGREKLCNAKIKPLEGLQLPDFVEV